MAISSHSTLAEVKEQFTKLGAALTTASATITPTHQVHTLTLPSSGTPSIDVISTTGASKGQLLVLIAAGAGAAPVTIRDTAHSSNSTTGKNIKCEGTTSSVITFDGANDNATFVFDGTNWIAISSVDAGPNQ